jgi:polyisoprenoid-binding protein YceI
MKQRRARAFRPHLRAIAAAFFALAAAARAAEPARFRLAPESRFEVKTKTAGLFGGLAHEHVVRAARFSGTIVWAPDAPAACSVEIEIDAEALVIADQGIDEDERREIAQTMRGKDVLDVARWKTISFRSTEVRRSGSELRVRGALTLHGTTRMVEAPAVVSLEPNGRLRARGSFFFRQSDFGIEPYSAGLGTIKVADEVELLFDAYGLPSRE